MPTTTLGPDTPPVILFAANNWDDVKFADRHLAEQLALRTTVLYVDPPMSRLTPRNKPALASALHGPRLRQLTPTLFRLTPVVTPFPERPGIVFLTRFLTARWVRNAVYELGLDRPFVIQTSPLGLSPKSMSALSYAYWVQDDFIAGAELFRVSPRRIRAGENRQIKGADIVIAATPGLFEKWSAATRKIVLIPNGCDFNSYTRMHQFPTPQDVRLDEPIVGFVGGLGARVDFDVLDAVAEAGYSLLLVGPKQSSVDEKRLALLLARDNVQWVGAKSFTDLIGYCKVMSVGLVPYTRSAFNEASFPLKILEYLAAGLPVVSTDIYPARWLDTDVLRIGRDPCEFTAHVAAAIAESDVPDLVQRRRSFARRHSWSERADAFLECLRSAAERSPIESSQGARGRARAGVSSSADRRR